MVKDIFHGKIIYIAKTGFKYKLLSMEEPSFLEVFSDLLYDFEKSYNNEPYDYGKALIEIEENLKINKLIKNKTDFAEIIGIKNYETVSRIEKGKGCPKGKRINSLKLAHQKLREYFCNNSEKSS